MNRKTYEECGRAFAAGVAAALADHEKKSQKTPELIDRKALLERMRENASFATSYKPYMTKEDIAFRVLKDAKEQALRFVEEAPTIKAVPSSEIYRIIAGHSDYHGDSILAAMTCIAEGKEVKPTRPIEAAPVVHGEWIHGEFDENHHWVKGSKHVRCSECWRVFDSDSLNIWHWCPQCGARMDGKTV